MRQTAVRVARNVAWLAAGEVALKGALFAAGVVVARGLGPAGMGAFTVAYGAALVLMQVLAGGQVEVLIRESARHREHGRALFALAQSHQRRLAAVVLPLAAASTFLVPAGDLRWTLLAFIPYAWLRRWLITAGAVFKGNDRMDVEVRGRALELVVALPCLAVVSALGGPVWTTGLAFSLGGIGGVVWISGRLRQLPATAGSPLARSVLVKEGAPFLSLSILHQLVSRADSFLLAGLGVPHAEIGRYGVATAPVQGLAAASQVLGLASYPSLARATATGAVRARVVVLLSGGGAALGGVLALLLYALRQPLIGIFFGPEFAASTALLGVLAWALPGACASMLVGVVLAATGRQAWALWTHSSMLVLSVAANLVAIPRWGVAGCAAVTVGVLNLTAIAQTALALAAIRRGAASGPAEPVYAPAGEGSA